MFDAIKSINENNLHGNDESFAKELISLQSEPSTRPIAHLVQAINDFSDEESDEEYPGVELYLDGLLFRF